MNGRFFISALLLVGLIGCAPITLVAPEKQKIGESYSVEPRLQWNQAKNPTNVSWTIDGFDLQHLVFYATLEEGEKLATLPGPGNKLPSFDPSMRANDVMEFLEETYVAGGVEGVETSNLRPANFGDRSGFRFDISMLSKDGLRYRGTAIGALHDGTLDLIVYRGTEIYYYERYEDEVEHIFSTIEVLS